MSANDDVFGMRTQDPTGALKHSEAGLTDADGNSAFGVPLNLLAYATHTTTHTAQTTTVTYATNDMPYKLRVLGVKVRCLANQPEDFREGYGAINAQVEDGDGAGVWTSVLNMEGLGDMEAGDVREMSVVDPTNAVIDEDEGLRVKLTSQANSYGENPIVTFIVEVQCLRVI